MNYAEKIALLLKNLSAAKLLRKDRGVSGDISYMVIEAKTGAEAMVAAIFTKDEYVIKNFKNGWVVVVIENAD